MPHRILIQAYHVLEGTVTFLLSSFIVASGALLTSSDPKEVHTELMILLLPMLGAIILSCAMILLNPNPEVRKIIAGRSLVAMFFGGLMPSVIGLIHPAIANLAIKPVVLLMSGGCIGSLAYALSWPFVKEMYARSARIAEEQANALEKKAQEAIGASKTTTVVVTEISPANKPNEK